MRLSTATAAVAAALAVATPASAQLVPARSGESGLLDVPDAEVQPRGFGLLGAELRFDKHDIGKDAAGPFPMYAVAGFGYGLETGLSARQWGQPGDPAPERTLFGAAMKLRITGAEDRPSGFAVDATLDRINDREVVGGRFIGSVRFRDMFRMAGYVGGEVGSKSGVVFGGAIAKRLARRTELLLEALGGPRGQSFGGAVQWRASSTMSLSLAFNYLPDDGYRVSLGFGFGPRVKLSAPTAPAAPVPVAGQPPEEAERVAFTDDRPRFRLKLHRPDPTGAEPRSIRHGPWAAPALASASAAPQPAAGVRAAAPSLDDLADAQLRDQEALAEARERRVRATADQLDVREKAAQDQVRRLEERERDLAGREQQLDARDKRIAVRGAPTQQQRDLESLEAQLSSQERNLSAQERSFGPALDAARGRERDAGTREDAERQEASRLAASASGVSSRSLQLDIRRQALAAKNRQLAALEAKLVAKGERIDALERQSRVKGERLDAWQRRLDARTERLDLLERRLAEPRPTPAAPPKPGEKAPAPKDKAVFVMVVKSPTSIVKERPSAPAAPSAGAAIHPGVAVEKAVAAATVVTFPTPASQLSELDRETIDNIARLAAKEQCELLIWARAKDPGLMAEAQRRAAEIRTRVMASGPLGEKQVVTRITTRPGAQGVDVVVSALRETAKPAAPAAPAAPARGAGPALEAGEAGKRQIREAVQSAQGSIEACVADMMDQRKLARAEGVLKLTISTAGKVAKVVSEGDLAGTGVGECLTGASASWAFPQADAEYVVDVPITVIRGGATR